MRTYALAVVSTLLLSTGALASSDSACFNRDVERIDHYINPPEGGDNAFFTGNTSANSNTNVTLVMDAKGTMNEFTQRLFRIRSGPVAKGLDLSGLPGGCSNTYLNNLTYFMPSNLSAPAGDSTLQGLYSSSRTYPDPGVSYSGGKSNTRFSDALQAGKAYQYNAWPSGPTQSGTPLSFDSACSSMSLPDACKACLQNKGYYLNPTADADDTSSNAGVFTTNWLRFHPVKWVLLTLAYKRLVNGPLLSQLRDAVVVTDHAGSKGGVQAQMMLPQSCSGGGRPQQQKITALDSVNYADSGDPLAETLFNVGWFMGGQQTSWIFGSASYSGTAVAGNKSGPCPTCGSAGDFIVLFADGRGDSANPKCTNPDSSKAAFCQVKQTCNTVGMGVGDGDDFALNPTGSTDVASAITGPSARTPWPGTCDMEVADDVAGYISTHSVTVGNAAEKIHTYVVAIGDPANTFGEMSTLQGVAFKGGGRYLVADDFRSLETNIEKVFQTIISTATSFSSAAITTVQSQGYTSAFIPRFTPLPGSQWTGTLARLDFFNEFAAGCTPADYGSIGDTTDNAKGTNPNKNSSCYDVYLTDAQGNFVGEVDGGFVQLDNTAAWDGGWPAKISDGGTVAAVPFWEASDVLTQRVNGVLAGGGTARNIFTAQPNGDGTYTSTSLLAFTEANVAQITPLLRLGGVNGDICNTLSSRTRNAYTTEDDCARDVIRFMQGRDVLMQNPYNREISDGDGGFVAGTPDPQHARPNILGDIFHSSPVLVTPPVPTFLCDLGIATQCVASLYDPSLEPGGKAAYAGDAGYVTTWAHRKQFILVGSNDGMIHAFNAGNYDAGTDTFDVGTGNELWAFIPPEMLPKLVRYMIGDSHELLVDGTPMVRDIWVDKNNDSQKQADEFHTIAIIGDREGGRGYTALDVTDPANPSFRWSWPPPGSTWSLNTGESWNDLGPSPAAIGPIAEKMPAGTDGGIQINGTAARERYVVAVGGGFDPAYLRGRSIDFLDAWTGQEVYRFAYEDSASTTDPRASLFPVAAPVSMLDTNADGIFDTAVVGDTGGQVWTISMWNPGELSSTSGYYDNWFGGRAFIQAPTDGSGTATFASRSPFFQRAVAAQLASGQIQIYLGAGDRSQIKDPNGGTCGLANLSACMRKGCTVDVQANDYGIGPSGGTSGTYAKGTFSYDGTNTPTFSASYDSAPAGVACSDLAQAKLSWNITCGGGASDAGSWEADVTCDWGASDGGVECPSFNARPEGAEVDAGSPTLAYSRFYSVRLFDTSGARGRFSTSAEAASYDSAAYTDASLVNADVTTTNDTAPGWYVRHAHSTDERTSSSALILGGCVVWNTLLPNANNNLTCSGTLPLDTAYGYQADVTSGAIQCGDPGSGTALATQRSTSRNTYVAPQPPAPVISVNKKSGQVAYGSVSLDPGAPPSASTMGTNDMVAPVHWLEVPRQVHDCRHNGNCP